MQHSKNVFVTKIQKLKICFSLWLTLYCIVCCQLSVSGVLKHYSYNDYKETDKNTTAHLGLGMSDSFTTMVNQRLYSALQNYHKIIFMKISSQIDRQTCTKQFNFCSQKTRFEVNFFFLGQNNRTKSFLSVLSRLTRLERVVEGSLSTPPHRRSSIIVFGFNFSFHLESKMVRDGLCKIAICFFTYICLDKKKKVYVVENSRAKSEPHTKDNQALCLNVLELSRTYDAINCYQSPGPPAAKKLQQFTSIWPKHKMPVVVLMMIGIVQDLHLIQATATATYCSDSKLLLLKFP